KERRGAEGEVGEAEGVGRWAGECRRDGATGISEEEDVAVHFTDEDIEVAVAVDVDERRRLEVPDARQAERIGDRRGEGGGGGAAGVAEEIQRCALADEEVQIAVAVDVDQLG